MGGVDIGTVTEVAYGEVADDKQIRVRMPSSKEESRAYAKTAWLRSRARVCSATR